MRFSLVFVLFCMILGPSNGHKREGQGPLWMPQLRNDRKSYIDSIVFANSLNAPPGLFGGFKDSPDLLFASILRNRPHTVACKLYASIDEDLYQNNVSNIEIEGLLLDILRSLPRSLTFQMVTVAPTRVVIPGISTSLLSTTSTSELEDAATAAGISTSSELFKSMKKVPLL